MRIMTTKNCTICNTPFVKRKNRKQITCSLKCRSIRWKKEGTFSLKNNTNWKGGISTYPDGYRIVKQPTHPFADKNGYVREHRLVMEQKIGRYLRPDEMIHHINGNRKDNRLENLEITNRTNHPIKIHNISRW